MNSCKRITLGILAHVDAGKTTLSESLLYSCGAIRQLGRVDHKDTFLDTDSMEKDRGITIFSKQAELRMGATEVMLLDTPGHVDFSAEMERCLSVLDYAVLVISGRDGVQSHTATLWSMLENYGIPTIIWVNKMDMEGAYESAIMEDIRENLTENASGRYDYEQIAMCGEELLEEYLEKESICDELLAQAVRRRMWFPVFFGSALKLKGVDELIKGIDELTNESSCGEEFAARVFKITRDSRGERLTHVKLTGGSISVREQIDEEKVSQIRVYSGDRYRTIDRAEAGMICQLTGLDATYAGQGLGAESDLDGAMLEPVLSYGVITPDDVNVHDFLTRLRIIEEEDPKLCVEWNEQQQEIQVRLMGEIQLEVIRQLIHDRTGVSCEFTEGSISYKESITAPVYGYGHFEPLRHYAEVRVRLEPLPRGTGIELVTVADEDSLDRNWQRLIMTHFAEKKHLGTLCGFPVSDVRIILVDGRAHLKHTEGGDFRQATYRAIRQALRTAAAQGEACILEPWYDFTLSVPAELVGRAMADVQRMGGEFEPPVTSQTGMSKLIGRAPVSEMRGYSRELAAYTRGYGQLGLRMAGYDSCHNEASVIAARGYDADRDIENTADSIFCSHGAGVNIPWYEVPEYAHLGTEDLWAEPVVVEPTAAQRREAAAATEADLKRIFEMTYGPEKKQTGRASYVRPTEREVRPTRKVEILPEYLLVDGYNIIFSWEELKELARINIDSAREALIEILCNFRGQIDAEIIVVFDAYRVKGGERRIEKQGNIHVVYTAEAESADSYIERTTFEIKKRRYRVRVATSDVAEQIIILNNNATPISPKTLREEVDRAEAATREWLEDYKLKLKLRTRNRMDF